MKNKSRQVCSKIERPVPECTAQSLKSNEKLEHQINLRKRIEKQLQETQSKLVKTAQSLSETLIALDVLTNKREKDKEDIQENIISNIKTIVAPYLEKLKNCSLNTKQKSYVSLLESNLNGIVSPFIRKLSSEYYRLTLTEIRVADFIKKGKSTKEIAELLHLSENTILTHRYKIRSKLALKNTKTNLASFLQHFSNQ